MTLWLDLEQRRAFRTWQQAFTALAIGGLLTFVIVELAWGFGAGSVLARVNWLGSLGLGLVVLWAIAPLTNAIEVGLRSFKGSAGSVSFEATGGDAASVTATVANAAGDTATATVPTAGDAA